MDTQLKFPMLSEAGKLETVPDQLISICKTRLDAVKLMVNLSGLSNEFLCEKTGIDKGHFSRILKGKASVPDDGRYTKLVELCRNNAPLQWENKFFGYKQVPITDARIQELQDELDQLKREEG